MGHRILLNRANKLIGRKRLEENKQQHCCDISSDSIVVSADGIGAGLGNCDIPSDSNVVSPDGIVAGLGIERAPCSTK
eukprot:scaffold2299_cov131-Cylindrotheca_fusiformis.AAC.19